MELLEFRLILSLVTVVIAIAVFFYSQPSKCADTGIMEIEKEGTKIYFRSHSTGDNCDTNVQKGAISEAVEKWLEDKALCSLCDYQCVKITHETTWEAYVAIATTEKTMYFVKNAQCDQNSGTYNPCSERKNNIDKPKSSALAISESENNRDPRCN